MDRRTARLPNRLARAEDGAAAPTAMFIEAPTCKQHSLACAATHPHVRIWHGKPIRQQEDRHWAGNISMERATLKDQASMRSGHGRLHRDTNKQKVAGFAGLPFRDAASAKLVNATRYSPCCSGPGSARRRAGKGPLDGTRSSSMWTQQRSRGAPRAWGPGQTAPSR